MIGRLGTVFEPSERFVLSCGFLCFLAVSLLISTTRHCTALEPRDPAIAGQGKTRLGRGKWLTRSRCARAHLCFLYRCFVGGGVSASLWCLVGDI